MPERLQRLAGRLSDATLDVETARVVRMRLEAPRKAVRHEAGSLHRLLHVHAEDQVIEQHLEHALRLEVAARCAERHQPTSTAHGHCRVRCEPRAFAGSNARSMSGHGPGLAAPGRGAESEAWNDRAL